MSIKQWKKSEVIVQKLQISQYKAVNTTTDSFSLRSIMVSLRLYREEIALLSNPEVVEEWNCQTWTPAIYNG